MIIRTDNRVSNKSSVHKKVSRCVIVFFLIVLISGISIKSVGVESIKSYLRESVTIRTAIRSYGINAVERGRPISDVLKLGLNNIPANLYPSSNFPLLTLDMKFKEYEKLRENREFSIKAGMIKTENLDWARGTISFGEQKLKAKMRLKGDLLDHIISDKWSLRIKIRKNQSLSGLTEFSIQAPLTRDFQTEPILHYVMRSKDIITPRNFFVNMQVNGKYLGNMYIEEHFVEAMTEFSHRPFGPILKTEGWGTPNKSIQPINFYDKDLYWNGDADVQAATASLRAILRGEVGVDGFFDKNKWATYLATTFIFKCPHGNMDPNLRFYYHPHKKIFEPVNYDNSCGQEGNRRIGNIMPEEGEIAYLLLKDDDIRSKVKDELLWWRDSSEATQLLDKVASLEKELRNSLLWEAPFLGEFSVDQISINQLINWLETFAATPEEFNFFDRKNNLLDFYSSDYKVLGRELVSFKGANFYLVKMGDRFLVEVESLIQQAIHLNQLLVKNEDTTFTVDLSKSTPIVEGSSQLYQLPGLLAEKLENADLLVSYNIEGSDSLLSKELILGFRADTKQPYITSSPSILDKYFDVDNINKVLTVLSNQSLVISDNLVLPLGYSLNIKAGVIIKFSQNAGLVVRGSMYVLGTGDRPVLLSAVDKFWGGIIVLANGAEVLIEHLNQKNATGQNIGGHNFKGAFTIVQGDSRILNSTFGDNLSEDALNIVQGVAHIEGITIFNTQSDGLDVDFGDVTLLNSTFIGIGNQSGGDAVDVSGTKISIQGVHIESSIDKGISIGESSKAIVKNLVVKNSLVAIAVKDSSILDVEGMTTENIGLADIMTYQKKPQFSGAVVTARSLNLSMPRFFNQRGSTIFVDGQYIAPSALNVDKMYDTIMKSNKNFNR